MVELLTPRLRLRRAGPEDLADLHGVLSDPRAMRYWSSPPHATLEETRAWLGRMIAAPGDAADDFVIEHRGRVIGKAGCWRMPEVGVILHPDYWGQGLILEAMTAAIPHAFALWPDVAGLEAEADPRNLGSLAVLAKLGFVEVRRAERTWCVAGEWSDSVYLALPRFEDLR